MEEKMKEYETKYNESLTELNDIKTAVAVSENNKEEEIGKIRKQCEQEIETMQALLRGKLFIFVLRKYNESLTEVSDIKSAVAVSEMMENNEEEIVKIRQQCQQEIETVQAFIEMWDVCLCSKKV